MASKTLTSLALFLAVNHLLFNLTAATYDTCPRDTLKIEACAGVLNLVNLTNQSALQPCCSLIDGLVDLDAALCLCTSLKVCALGINLDIPVQLTVLLTVAGALQAASSAHQRYKN